jgi:peptide-methionine (R)-S-oxide reductase
MKKIIKNKEEWKKILTPLQYKILREKGTEPPTWRAGKNGTVRDFYYCAACDNRLFAGRDKYDSGSGWPSFTRPTIREAVIIAPYFGQGENGAEVLCSLCEGHLGHIFLDGPAPDGRRFCINGAVLKRQQS